MMFLLRLTIYSLIFACPFLAAEDKLPSLAKNLYQSYRSFSDKNKTNQAIQFSQIGDSEKFLIQIGNPSLEPLSNGEGFSLKAKEKEWIFIVIWPNQIVPDSDDYRKILLPDGAVFVERRNIFFKGNAVLVQILCPEILINRALSATNEILLN